MPTTNPNPERNAMSHLSRARRRANAARRKVAAKKQKPLTMIEQEDRAANKAQSRLLRYPFPPTYPDVPRGIR